MSETREELYEKAKALDVEGRSEMKKGELEEAVEDAKSGGESGSRKGVLKAHSATDVKSTGNSGQDDLRGEGVEKGNKHEPRVANYTQSGGLAKLERDGDQGGATRDAKTSKAKAPIGTRAVLEETPEQPGAASD